MSELLSQVPFSSGVSDPRPPQSLRLLDGDLGQSHSFPIGQRGERGPPPRLPIGRRRRRSAAARALLPFPAETLCDWPLRPRPGRWAPGPSGAAGSPGARQLPARGGKFESGLEEKLPGPSCRLPFSPVGTGRLSELLEAPPPAPVPRSRSQPCTPNGSSVRDGPGPRAQGSSPAGDSLTWRVGRPVPCGGCSEDWRGELGAGQTLCHPRGRRVQPRERAPASAAAPSARGLGT